MNFMSNVRLSKMSKKQLISKRGKWEVILHNDSHNTFDHVIDCLMEICGHSYIQSVQCATVVHGSTKCSIYIDSFDDCESVRHELKLLGLTATVSKDKSYV